MKLNLLRLTVILLMLTGMGTSCQEKQEEEKPVEEVEETETLATDFPLEGSYFLKLEKSSNLSGTVKLYVIRSLDEFIQIFEKNPPAHIDFNRNSLLAAWGETPSGSVAISKTFNLTEDNQSVFDIVVTSGNTADIGSWRISVLTPRLNADDEVHANITYQSGYVPSTR